MSESIWNADELPGRPEWSHRLEAAERAEMLSLLELKPAENPLPILSRRLATIRQQLEEGAGAVRVQGCWKARCFDPGPATTSTSPRWRLLSSSRS